MTDQPTKPERSPVVRAFLRSGLQEVLLPSGKRITVHPRRIQDLLIDKRLPPDLVEVARNGGLDTRKPEHMALGARYMRVAAAAAVTEFWNDEKDDWEDVRLTDEELPRYFDDADLEALEAIGMKRETPEEVTISSRFLLGQISEEEAAQQLQEARVAVRAKAEREAQWQRLIQRSENPSGVTQ